MLGIDFRLSATLGLWILLPAVALAQGSTSGTLTGTVVADEDGAALPGVAIEIAHLSTGQTQHLSTDEGGRYALPYARAGGPYRIRAALDGFQTVEAADVFVKLGETTLVDLRLPLAALEETVTVVGEASPLINRGRTGAASSVTTEEIERLPTLSRNLQDFARTDPFFTVTAQNEGPEALSVAGRSNRYNNISIDGSVNNDTFGLAASGTPGGQAGTTPISLDAIQELQLVTAPFDVRQGGFSGGGINAVTRSGGNQLKGSVFFYTRDKNLIGDGPDTLGEFGEFEDDQVGFRLGGPLARDRAFFFVNADIEDRTQPSGWSLDGSGGQTFLGGQALEAAQRFRSILMDRYGYDPGGFGQDSSDTPSDKIFARVDFNLADNHHVVLRHNYVDAARDINNPGATTFEFPSEAYAFTTETNSTVLQWVGQVGEGAFNELRLARQDIKDRRAGRDGIDFPWIEIENVIPNSGREFEAGTEPFSTENSLDQEIFEIHNDLTWLRGDHTFTLGTHNELFSFDNVFVANSFGSYEFADLDAFEAGIARRFQRSFVNPGQDRAASFDVQQVSLYLGDQWNVRENLTLTLGLRFDAAFLPDAPAFNPEVAEIFGLRTDELPDGEVVTSPRFGFNWSPSRGDDQVRGGIGVFAGRTPYVWISNQFSNNGLAQTALSAFGVPFNPDPRNQPSSAEEIGARVSTQSVDLIDPDFEFPQVLRYDIGYERRLPWWNLVASIEAVFTDTLKDIDYKNINLTQTGTQFDGRPIYGTLSRGFGGAFLITNTDEGEATNLSAKIEYPFRDGISGFISYAWGESESVNDGTSSRAVSNWRFNPAFDVNAAEVGPSQYAVEHRFSASFTYRAELGGGWGSTLSAFYNLQSGRTYSTIYRFSFPSINGDQQANNDLIYVPSGPDDVIITNGTWEQLDAYIRGDEGLDRHRGSVVPRNASRAPWNHTLDLRAAVEVPVGLGHLEITADIINFLNLLDSDSGSLRYANFGTLSPVRFDGVDGATGRPIYTLDATVTDPEDNPKFLTHNTRSRWQARLGVRWSF